MFHGLDNRFLYTAHRLVCRFVDAKGEVLECSGTGFFVMNEAGLGCLVTNRHVLDISYTTSEFRGFELQRLFVSGKVNDSESGLPNIDMQCEIVNPDVKYSAVLENDIACLMNPEVINLDGNDQPTVDFFINHDLLATRTDLDEKISVCDFVAYPGFPTWHDRRQRRPILRTGTVASDPRFDYSWSDGYKGECIAYEAFSYGGSSGSPVFALQKALRPGENIKIPGFRELKFIGINAGHLPGANATHSGISYMYKSSAILDIIDA